MEQFQVKDSLGYASWLRWYSNFEEEAYSANEQMLLELCDFYGVDEADVELLLDYGYSVDEIEEMLCDHSLLYEALGMMK